MPVHLPSQTRREFLVTLGVGVFACSTTAFGEERAVEEDVVYLVNDTHIGERQATDSPVPSHFRQVVAELVERKRKPAFVLINGDLAAKNGQPGDYRHFARLLQPLRDAKIDTHLTMGNHDNRKTFWEVLREEQPKSPAVESRQIAIVETRHANFFLLDSLKETMVTPGTLGQQQRDWLAAALDERKNKPAIVVAHHNPRLGGDPLHFPGGLTDSEELWQVLAKRQHVKAYVHGHIHDRSLAAHQGIHIVNTPATSYVANPSQSTTGWTIARLTAGGMTLETRTTDPQHSWNGEKKTIEWRT